MAVVVEVCELIGPLRDNSKRIFEESNDDEEATNAGEISSIGRELAIFSDSPSPRGGRSRGQARPLPGSRVAW